MSKAISKSGRFDPFTTLAALVEIAENLHRRELGEIEKAELMAKWVEISATRAKGAAEAGVDVSAQDAPKLSVQGRPEGRKPDDEKPAQVAPVSGRGGRGKVGGIRQAARELGVPRDQVSRAVKVASLSPEAKAAGRAAPQAVLLEAARPL